MLLPRNARCSERRHAALYTLVSAHQAKFAIIGNPENRRVIGFQHALRDHGLAPAEELGYLELLQGQMARLQSLSEGVVLRIDSPGENFAVTRELLLLGVASRSPGAAGLPAERVRRLGYERGRILHPAQQFAGFADLMDEIGRVLAARPDIRAMSPPPDIVAMFDKRACRRRLRAADIAMAPGLGSVCGYDDLRERMRQRGYRRVFVKLRYGSAASGVVAYRVRDSGEEAVTSTAVQRRGGRISLFNSLEIRAYHRRRDIRDLIDALAAEGVEVEHWIDKARLGDDRFDIRVVVIAGRARHAILRCSRAPMTNLHLGNRRAAVARLVEEYGAAVWRSAAKLAERALAVYPDTHYAGVDVMLESGSLRPYIVELNAFGDLLPGLLDRGQNTFSAEIAELLA